MGVDPADLMQDPADRPWVPTFDEYIPEVEAAVSSGTAGTYGSYWKRIAAKWGPAAAGVLAGYRGAWRAMHLGGRLRT
jgi:hypothetical protein